MTTGSLVTGSPTNSAAYRYKSWSGGDDPKKSTPQPYDMQLKEQNCELSQVYDDNGLVIQGYFNSNLTNCPALTSYQENQLSQKLLEAIRSSEFDLGVFAAESKQTLDLLKASALGIYNFCREIKKGNVGNAAKALSIVLTQSQKRKYDSLLKAGDIPSTVLALKYGWLPLLQDAYAACMYLKDRLKERKLRYTVSMSIPSQWIDTYNGTSPVRASGFRQVRLTAHLSEPPSARAELGLLNPALAMWNLLPWSFIWDWFIPIGDFLDQASYFRGLENVVYERSEFATAYGIMNTIPQPSKPQYRIGGMVTYKVVSLKRTISTSFVPPLPGFKPIQKALGLGHIVNAAALITSRKLRNNEFNAF